jgi:hypothetical protein
MKRLQLTLLSLLLFITMVMAACGAAQEPAVQDTGGLMIALNTRPDPPMAGQIELIVTIKDAGQLPVDGAETTLLVSHRSMATMLMQKKAVSRGTGLYSATFDFSQDSQGDWQVTVEVRNVDPKTIRKDFVLTIP